MSMSKIDKIIKALDLLPHPEGGFFKETYRSKGVINKESLGNQFLDKRNYSTGIYFLLTSDMFSAFHRIKQDEMWHFYDGSPIKIHMIDAAGNYSFAIVGKNISQGHIPQFVVPAGYLFAATVVNNNDFSLVGCTVSPGFDFRDFEMPTRDQLVDDYPQHKDLITRLTKKVG